jgi:hypothetical protein
VRGREEAVVVYAVPDPSTISELQAEPTDVDSQPSAISNDPIV